MVTLLTTLAVGEERSLFDMIPTPYILDPSSYGSVFIDALFATQYSASYYGSVGS